MTSGICNVRRSGVTTLANAVSVHIVPSGLCNVTVVRLASLCSTSRFPKIKRAASILALKRQLNNNDELLVSSNQKLCVVLAVIGWTCDDVTVRG